MVRIANYFEMLMSGHYVLMILSGRPNLRDHLVRAFFPGAEGPTPYLHFTTVVQHDTARRLQNPGNEWQAPPETCQHDGGLRAYNARRPVAVASATGACRICDQCGTYWVKMTGGQ